MLDLRRASSEIKACVEMTEVEEMRPPFRSATVAGLFAAAIAFLTVASERQHSLHGFWESEGYGFVFEVSGSTMKSFEVTKTSCVASFVARKRSSSVLGREATFETKDDGVFFVRTGGTNDRKLLHQEETVPDILIRRVTALPPVCRQPTADTALGNFEVFAQTWAEHYISFERRGTDWKRVVAHARQKIHPRITPEELFTLLETMIKPMGDLHSYVSAPSLKRSTRPFWRPSTDRLFQGRGLDAFAEGRRWELFAMTDLHLRNGTKMFCNRGLHYGALDAGMGYLRIRSFGAYSRSNDMQALESCLDAIFASPIRSLVIDMRLALGGSDELGLAIAGRLATRPYVAYTVQARFGDDWTTRQPIIVQPSARPGFRGPIVVLTGPITMSAAESFVQSLIARDAPVTRVGEATQGVFCDVLSRRLPNGWTFGLPNAVYLTGDNKTFDVTGIPPDISSPVFTDPDIAQRKDPALETARRVLSRVAK
jgi:hypothetical protein